MIMDVDRRVARTISDQLQIPIKEISMPRDLVDDLGADSLDMIEMCTSIEIEFDVQIADENWQKVRTVADVIQLVSVNMA